MLRSLTWLFLLAITTTPALAAVPVATVGPASALTVRFVPIDSSIPNGPGSAAFLDFGRVSAKPGAGRRGGIVVSQRVAVRLDGPPGAPTSARLSVALTEETPGCTVRLDGKTLSTFPRLIDPIHRVGSASVHEIEVTIPTNVPAGTVLSNLQWLAESD
jgi:hypothetical protein